MASMVGAKDGSHKTARGQSGSDDVAPLGRAWTFCFKCIVKLLKSFEHSVARSDSHFKPLVDLNPSSYFC